MIVNNYVVLGILFLFSIIIYLILCYLHKKLKNIISEDPNWDANKAREESEIGLKREVEKEINRLYHRIRISAEVGNNFMYDIYISTLAIEYFKSKNFTVTIPYGSFNYYKISWEENK